MNNDVKSLLRAAIECSIYVNPLKPGLFGTELAEIARAAGYQPGEINDAMLYAGESFIGGGGFITPDAGAIFCSCFPRSRITAIPSPATLSSPS